MEQRHQLSKAKNNIFPVVDGDVKVRSLLMWLFFTQICLFAGNMHYELLFFDNACCVVMFSLGTFLVVSLCLQECFDGCQSRICK
jgi:hypothetical protein